MAFVLDAKPVCKLFWEILTKLVLILVEHARVALALTVYQAVDAKPLYECSI